MPYETGANELQYQKEYAKKRKAAGDTRSVWDRVISRAEGAAPSRSTSDNAVKGGGNVDAPNKPSTASRLTRIFGSLQVTGKEEANLKKVEKKSRP